MTGEAEGVRLRNKTGTEDVVSRLIESTTTDLPSSAKRMVNLIISDLKLHDCSLTCSMQLEGGLHAAAEFSSDVASQAGAVATHAGEICRKVIEVSWKVCHFQALPDWLQDNDYLIWGHRPPLPSFSACFQSIFRIHTETVNQLFPTQIVQILKINFLIGFFLGKYLDTSYWLLSVSDAGHLHVILVGIAD